MIKTNFIHPQIYLSFNFFKHKWLIVEYKWVSEWVQEEAISEIVLIFISIAN